MKRPGLTRAVLWWMLGGALTVTAGEAEHVRRDGQPGPGVCIGSTLLLRGMACPSQPTASLSTHPAANPL